MMSQPESQLLMERSETPATVRQQIADAGIKTILFHVHDDDSVMERLQLTLSVARAFGAHVHFLHVTPIEAYTIVDVFGGTFVNQQIVEAFEQQTGKLRQRIEAHMALEDIPWDYEEITGGLMPHLVHSAALADLVVTGREPHEREFGGPAVALYGDLLTLIRAPLLITGDGSISFDPLGPAVIAWNGSYEAANAVRASLPLLRAASLVEVVEFKEKNDRQFPSTKLLEYLSRHGIAADLDVREEPLGGPETGLVDYAKRKGAGYIVMGGYSHSRAGEFLFGGVTRALLKECPVALLMAR